MKNFNSYGWRILSLIIYHLSSPPDEDLDFVFMQFVLEPLQHGDNAFKSCDDIRKACNAATDDDDQHLGNTIDWLIGRLIDWFIDQFIDW